MRPLAQGTTKTELVRVLPFTRFDLFQKYEIVYYGSYGMGPHLNPENCAEKIAKLCLKLGQTGRT